MKNDHGIGNLDLRLSEDAGIFRWRDLFLLFSIGSHRLLFLLGIPEDADVEQLRSISRALVPQLDFITETISPTMSPIEISEFHRRADEELRSALLRIEQAVGTQTRVQVHQLGLMESGEVGKAFVWRVAWERLLSEKGDAIAGFIQSGLNAERAALLCSVLQKQLRVPSADEIEDLLYASKSHDEDLSDLANIAIGLITARIVHSIWRQLLEELSASEVEILRKWSHKKASELGMPGDVADSLLTD